MNASQMSHHIKKAWHEYVVTLYM